MSSSLAPRRTRRKGNANCQSKIEGDASRRNGTALQAGLHGPNALAGRRTFAVRLHRKGFDLKLISELLGHATVTATKHLIDGDPVKLGTIVAGIV